MTAPVWGQLYRSRSSSYDVAHGLEEFNRGGSMLNAEADPSVFGGGWESMTERL